MSTNPTNVPVKNQNQPGIPPLPYVHVKVDTTTPLLELRVVTHRTVMCILAGDYALSISKHSFKHGLLGKARTNILLEQK